MWDVPYSSRSRCRSTQYPERRQARRRWVVARSSRTRRRRPGRPCRRRACACPSPPGCRSSRRAVEPRRSIAEHVDLRAPDVLPGRDRRSTHRDVVDRVDVLLRRSLAVSGRLHPVDAHVPLRSEGLGRPVGSTPCRDSPERLRSVRGRARIALGDARAPRLAGRSRGGPGRGGSGSRHAAAGARRRRTPGGPCRAGRCCGRVRGRTRPP